jgi:hypothetical protein
MIGLALLVPAIAAINRVRGGGCSFISSLPGHARFYAAAMVAAVSALVVGPIDGLVVGACYLAWALLPWGRWYDLGALEGYPNRPLSPVETIVNRLSGGEDAIAFTIRNLVGMLPAAALINPLFLILPAFQLAAYGAAWKWAPAAPIRLAEYLTGALWGAFIWALA